MLKINLNLENNLFKKSFYIFFIEFICKLVNVEKQVKSIYQK